MGIRWIAWEDVRKWLWGRGGDQSLKECEGLSFVLQNPLPPSPQSGSV